MGYSKVRISGIIKLESGLHIGASSAFAAIGAIDSPVIKDPISNLPIIPGSSLKGKMRYLLSKVYSNQVSSSPKDDDVNILRLFGSSEVEEYRIGRLVFRDSFLANESNLRESGIDNFTEVKFENTIDRITAVANPRQIERAIKGSEFGLEVFYTITNQSIEEIKEDIKVIKEGFELIQLDYIGGSGSRGYGKVTIEDLEFNTVFGDVDIKSIIG